jgi:ACT domain.
MAIKVKSITLWRRDVAHKPGALASTLEPLFRAGADLQVVMGYGLPGGENRAVVELYPVSGKKAAAAAGAAGLSASTIPTLLVEGDNRPGIGHAMARAIADAGINISFLLAQAIGRKFTAVLGFETEADAKTAAALIKKARPPAKK